MCYAIPGKVKRFEGKLAVIDYFGEERKAHNELDNLLVGDYVYAQGGYVITKVSAAEAESTLAAWKETFFELQEVDVELSRLDLGSHGQSRLVKSIDRIMAGHIPDQEEMLDIFSQTDSEKLELIYKAANFLRQKHLSNSCCVHGIIEISNLCDKSCNYCGISILNEKVKRYRMAPDEVVATAIDAAEKYGFKSLVLQSGESSAYTIDELCYMVRTIKEKAPMLVCVSFGEVGLDGLEKLYKAGARAILMRFETSNPILYAKLHPGQNLDLRLAHLKKAYELGYLVMTGGLIGLPGQSDEDIINDIILTKELKAEMASFGPCLAHPDTPLANIKPLDKNKVLKTLALMRFYDRDNAKILVTTAFETLDKDARKDGLLAGANSVMLNVTPIEYRGHYSIYPNRAHAKDEIADQISETLNILHALGRAPTDLGIAERS